MTDYLDAYQLQVWRNALLAVEETMRSTDTASRCKQPMLDLQRTVATQPRTVLVELGQLARA